MDEDDKNKTWPWWIWIVAALVVVYMFIRITYPYGLILIVLICIYLLRLGNNTQYDSPSRTKCPICGSYSYRTRVTTKERVCTRCAHVW